MSAVKRIRPASHLALVEGVEGSASLSRRAEARPSA